MAVLSGAHSPNVVPHNHDCVCHWWGDYPVVQKVGCLAAGYSVGVVAFVWWTLGGGLVPELAASSCFAHPWCADCHPRPGLVRRWLSHCIRDASDGVGQAL